MVEKSDIEELEKFYAKVTNTTHKEPVINREPIYTKESVVEVQTIKDKVFVPIEPLNRNIDHIIEVMAEKRKQEWIEASYKKLEQLLYQDVPSQPQPSLAPPIQIPIQPIEDISITKPKISEPKKSGDVNLKVAVAAFFASVGIGGLICLTLSLAGLI